MKNRFNNIDSKEWLPYQKSWFKMNGNEELYRKTIRFFMKFDSEEMNRNFFFFGSDEQMNLCKNIAQEEAAQFQDETKLDKIENIQFALIDFRYMMEDVIDEKSWLIKKDWILDLAFKLKDKLYHRQFLSIIIPNLQTENQYFPFAWDLAKTLAETFSLKDEKIACQEKTSCNTEQNYFHTDGQYFYQLFFRNDEKSENLKTKTSFPYYKNQEQKPSLFSKIFPSWYILKPKSRNKKEVLHPAKFPEEIVNMHLDVFTKERDIVLDPMCGTGSTVISSIEKKQK